MIRVNAYDKDNVFAKIIRKEIPSTIIYEDNQILAFKDAYPVAPIHILVIPKGEYIDFEDFTQKASNDDIINFFKKVNEIAENLNLNEGYRIISNIGQKSGQSVFHFHIHIISGKVITGLI